MDSDPSRLEVKIRTLADTLEEDAKRCSFCCRLEADTGTVVEAETGARICESCIATAAAALAKGS